MAFDRTDQADLLALKTEVETDPISMGYAAVVTQTQKLLDLLNKPANNVGGETIGEDFTPLVMLEVMNSNSLSTRSGFDEGGLEYVKALLAMADSPDYIMNNLRGKFRSCFDGNGAASQTVRDSLDARIRGLSRAEVLFGQDTVISREDWFAARDS